MNELSKITAEHLGRCAIVYVRQSSAAQVEHNRESTVRQYDLAERAVKFGWRRDQVKVIDEDLGISGSGLAERTGFARMTAEVALGQVGIVLGLEVSRLARNNADWYRLLDLCGLTHTLIGDGDGIYHPGLFNDRLVLGLKGTMSEAELHVLRARLLGGIRNKAARGELHRGLPVGLVRGEADGEVLLHPDESVRAAIHAVFERFAEFGSARRVWLWFRSQGLRFPLHSTTLADLRWVAPTYTKIHQVLTNPFYAGVYVYGRTQQTRYIDAAGRVRKRITHRGREQWPVFIRDHHAGYIDWGTFDTNQKRLAQNIRPRPHQSGGAVREKALRCCKVSPYADTAVGAWLYIIAAVTRRLGITAPARTSSTAGASTASTLAACRSMRLSPKHSLRHLRLQGWRPHSKRSSSSKPITRRPWRSSVATSSVHATTRSAPSDAIAPWIRRTDSSRVDLKQSGKTRCRN